jgi:hypothetical protein
MITRITPLLLLLFVVLPLAQITRVRAVDIDPTDFLPSGSGALRTVEGDVDGDGRADLVARTRENGDLWLLPGSRSGFSERRLIGAGFDGYDVPD